MKKVLCIAFALVAMSAIASGADNTIGTWKLNVGKSKMAAGQSPITSLTQTREAIDGGSRQTVKGERADGSKINGVDVVKYDGKEVPVTITGVPYDTVAAKQIDANTFTAERTKKGGKYHTTARTVVSKDGKVMTVTSKGTDADGKAITSVLVYDKQ